MALEDELGGRVCGLILTVLEMLLQCGVWFVIMASAIARLRLRSNRRVAQLTNFCEDKGFIFQTDAA